MGIADYTRAFKEIAFHPLNADRKWRAAADYLGWNLGRRLLQADYLLPMAGDAVIILSNRQNYATLSYTCVLWDFEEMLFLTHLLRPGELFVDIGANAGGYTVLASAVAGARSLAFEPVPATFAELTRNIRLNGIEGLAEPHQLGIGDAEGTLSMTADRGGLNHIVARAWQGATVDVPVRRLDDVLAGAACRLLKIDAEGFEMNILQGADRTLADPGLSAVVMELNGTGERYGHSDESVHRAISRYGFSPYRYDPSIRGLTALATFNRDSLNTLYVRDVEATTSIVAAAPKIRVRDKSF